MLVGWIELARRPFTKRNDFVSVDARGYSTSPKDYEMITSPPNTSDMSKRPNAVITSPNSVHEKEQSPPLHSPPSPSSQYTSDYFGKEGESKSRHLSFSLPREADYKCPTLSFSTPQPPSAGRSFSRDSYGRPYQQPPTGRTSPGRPLSPLTTTRRESGGSTFSSAYDWDPATTYAPPSTQIPSYSRPDAYHLSNHV